MESEPENRERKKERKVKRKRQREREIARARRERATYRNKDEVEEELLGGHLGVLVEKVLAVNWISVV